MASGQPEIPLVRTSGGQSIGIELEGRQSDSPEVLRDPPHVHLGRAVAWNPCQVAGGILRHVCGDNRKALWTLHSERFERATGAPYRSENRNLYRNATEAGQCWKDTSRRSNKLFKRIGGSKMVGASGFEPPTSRSRTVRSTKLSHAPTRSK